jgi:sterol desaturase/sphingolipid hydroxylase (fatty acid hydroxylase superfamily)
MLNWIVADRLVELALTFVGLAAVFVALTALSALAGNREWYRRPGGWWREFRTNAAFFFVDGLIVSPLIMFPAFWLATLLPRLPSVPLPVPITVCAALVVGDLAGYWRHRLQHSRWFWPAHGVHHSDREMTWLTLARMHPLDRLSTITLDSLALALLGFPPYAIFINNLVRTWYGYFEHANVRLHYGPLSGLFISPVAHRWHHSLEMSGKNFATLFSVWDRAFGTYHQASKPPSGMGIQRPSRGFIGELVYPLIPSSYVDGIELLDRFSLAPVQPEPSE